MHRTLPHAVSTSSAGTPPSLLPCFLACIRRTTHPAMCKTSTSPPIILPGPQAVCGWLCWRWWVQRKPTTIEDISVAAALFDRVQDRLSQIERDAGKQHGFLASVEKLAAANAADPTKRAPTSSGISRCGLAEGVHAVHMHVCVTHACMPTHACVCGT